MFLRHTFKKNATQLGKALTNSKARLYANIPTENFKPLEFKANQSNNGQGNQQNDRNGQGKGGRSFPPRFEGRTLFEYFLGGGVLAHLYTEHRRDVREKFITDQENLSDLKKELLEILMEVEGYRCLFREQLINIDRLKRNQLLLQLDNVITRLEQLKKNVNGGLVFDTSRMLLSTSTNIQNLNLLENAIDETITLAKLLKNFTKLTINYRKSGPSLSKILDEAKILTTSSKGTIEESANAEKYAIIQQALLNLCGLVELGELHYADAFDYLKKAYAIDDSLSNQAIIQTNVARTMAKLLGLYSAEDQKEISKKLISLVKSSYKTFYDSNYPAILYDYAIVLALCGKNQEAQRFFERAAFNYQSFANDGNNKDLRPVDINAESYYCQFLINEQKNDKAILDRLAHLSRETMVKPEQATLFYNRAIAQYNLGQYKEAQQDMEVALQFLLNKAPHTDEVLNKQLEHIKNACKNTTDNKPSPLNSELYLWTLTKDTLDTRHKNEFLKQNSVDTNKLKKVKDSFIAFTQPTKEAEQQAAPTCIM